MVRLAVFCVSLTIFLSTTKHPDKTSTYNSKDRGRRTTKYSNISKFHTKVVLMI